MMEARCAARGDQAPQLLDVGGAPNERQGQEVDPEPQSEPGIALVLLGQRRRRQSDTREIHSLATLELPARLDLAGDLRPFDSEDAKREGPVVEENAIAFLDVPRERLVVGGDEVPAAGNGAGGDRHPPALLEEDAPFRKIPHADLGTAQIGEDRRGSPPRFGGAPHAGVGRAVALLRAVREVEPEDVDPCFDEPRERRLIARGRSERGDNLGPAILERLDTRADAHPVILS